ncbi:hypothetical protein E8E11_007792 [Didymella keratinophila]|nr:hypothetical protein E8E11_007792 [Didymella keratinophila]
MATVRQLKLRFYYPYTLDDVDNESSVKSIQVSLEGGRQIEIEMFATYDEACSVPDSWDYFHTSSRVVTRSDSEAALSVIQEWLTECIDEHSVDSLCKSPSSPRLPTRVVDVGHDEQSVKLIDSNGERKDYICLSHCWGLAQIITTTKTTLNERKRGIPWGLLSKTFQDAILMTRTLGFRYIWIDSLCIVQDDALDWEKESAKMASVYSNGYLTIAGTRSANGNGGLFSTKHDVEVSGATPDGDPYCIYFRERIDHHIEMIPDSTIEHYPLLTRAWVYQERMLSTRVLHFGHFELFFECRSSIQCECGYISHEEDDPGIEKSLVKIEFADALSQLNHPEPGEVDVNNAYYAARMWRTVVSSYSALSLTKSTDRLPALGGLARQTAAARQTTYYAGLWKDTLNDDLLWATYREARTVAAAPRPSPRTAPTWSWASAAGYVDYNDTIIFSSFDEGSEHAQEPHQHFAAIEQCTALPSSVDEFGAIAEGLLTIRGLLVTGSIEYGTVEHAVGRLAPGPAQPYKAYLFCHPSGKWPIRPDYLFEAEGSDSVPPSTEIYCLRMSHLHVGPWQKLMSLVLRKAPGRPECFERIGMLEVKSRTEDVDPVGTLFEIAVARTITIV